MDLHHVGETWRRTDRKIRAKDAVQQNISYQRELMPGETIYIETYVNELRGKVIRFTHEMRNGESGELCATCELTVVHMDAKARKAIPFPDDVVEKVEAALKA